MQQGSADQGWPPAGQSDPTRWTNLFGAAQTSQQAQTQPAPQPGPAGQPSVQTSLGVPAQQAPRPGLIGPSPGGGFVLPGLNSQQGRALSPEQLHQQQQQQQHVQRVLASNPTLQAQFAQRLQQSTGTVTAYQGHATPRPHQPTTTTLPVAASTALPPAPVPPRSSQAAQTPSPAPSVQIQARPPTASQATAPKNVSVRTVEAVPAVKRIKKRARPETYVSDQLADSLGFSPYLHLLHKAERQVDLAIAQKHAALQEALHNPPRVPKRLRVYVSNTHAHQADVAHAPAGHAREPPSWVLTITPRLLEVADAEGFVPPPQPPRSAPGPAAPHQNAMRLIRRLTVANFPSSAGPVTRTWDAASQSGLLPDSIQLRGAGSSEVRLSISLDVQHDVPRFKLVPALAQLLGKSEGSRQSVLRALWLYIRNNGLQNEQVRSMARLDAPLQRLLQCSDKEMRISSMDSRINDLLLPLDPLRFDYTIRVTGPSPVPAEAYDIPTHIVASNAKLEAAQEPTSIAAVKAALDTEIDARDQQVGTLLATAKEHKRRHAILTGFAQSPVDFINGLLAAQTRELRTAAGGPMGSISSGNPPLAMSTSDHFKGEWVEDAVMRYLHRRLAAAA